MKKNIIVLVLIIISSWSCKEKDNFNDLGKQIEGKWKIYDALISRSSLDTNMVYYNPKDSLETAMIDVSRIDELNVKVTVLVRKENGQIVFKSESNFSLSRDFENKQDILFNTLPTSSGSYNGENKIFSIYSVGINSKGESAGIIGWFKAKR